MLALVPSSPSFPRSPPDLSIAGPVVPRDTDGTTVQWPSLDARLIEAFLLDRCKSYAVVHE